MFWFQVDRILVCPLNWGLGHATRCVLLIRRFLCEGKEVVIAADGYPLQVLRKEFPLLTFIEFPSYKIRYGKGNSQVWAMFKCFPNIVTEIFREHQQLKKIVAEHQINCVLSDNRFGLWHSGVHSVYMTHQLMIKMPRGLRFLEPLAWLLHQFFINKYNVCLVPDVQENGGWAGDLTHKYPLPKNARFIGILSRFSSSCHSDESQNPLCCEGTAGQTRNDNLPKVLAIVSGVEPQRSIFEKILIEELSKKDFKSLIVSGLPSEEKTEKQVGNAKIVSHLLSAEMEKYLQHTPAVICRSGYSSVMDLAVLGRRAVLVPTPGQTEQEYLGKYLSEKQLFTCVSQGNLRKFLIAMHLQK